MTRKNVWLSATPGEANRLESRAETGYETYCGGYDHGSEKYFAVVRSDFEHLPRVDAASDRVDWFNVWLVAVPVIAAIPLACVHLCGFTSHPLLEAAERTIKGYAAAHLLADRRLMIFGLVAASYPAVLWMVVGLMERGRRRRSLLRHRDGAAVVDGVGLAAQETPRGVRAGASSRAMMEEGSCKA